MKKIRLLGISLCLFHIGFAQQTPTISNPANGGQNNGDFWSRAGNTNSGGNVNNIFGTKWNSPIYTITNGLSINSYRSKMNGEFFFPGTQYPVNTYGFGNTPTTINTSGYMLLGYNNPLQTNTSQYIYNDKGAFSLLHLNGKASAVQELGFRPWMKTGITFTGNRDLSYIGLRQIVGADPNEEDHTETVIAWSDNATGITDEMCFRFTGALANTATTMENTTLSPDDLDGLHVARFTPSGRFGLGSSFGNTDVQGNIAPYYVSPQSLFHMSYPHQTGATKEPYGFMQITYRNIIASNPLKVGLGEKLTDGLRFGIDNDIQNQGSAPRYRHLNAYLRWQEASSFIIQTDSDTTSGGIETSERLRITSAGAVRQNQGETGANANLTKNLTRIGISHNGSIPVTKPMSLLHLGYNTGNTFSQLVNQAYPIGWRKWMDLGVYMSNRQNHVFLGLKPEGDGSINNNPRMDAVLSWGDKSGKTDADNFRFVFTADSLDINENVKSRSQLGYEMMRIYPAKDTVYTYNNPADSSYALVGNKTYGRVGIGNFSVNGINEQPTNTLDVIGNARLRFLPDSLYEADPSVLKVVMVDSNGVLRWSNNVSGKPFAECPDTVNAILEADSKLTLNDHNLVFQNDTTSTNVLKNKVGIGYLCNQTLPGKLSVYQNVSGVINSSTYAGTFLNQDVAGSNNRRFYGVEGSSIGIQSTGFNAWNVGGRFTALNAKTNIAVLGELTVPSSFASGLFNLNFGGQFLVKGRGATNYGISSVANNATNTNYGISIEAATSTGLTTIKNYGVYSIVSNATTNYGVFAAATKGSVAYGGRFEANQATVNYGVYGRALFQDTLAGSNRAGYFAGQTETTNFPMITSDAMFKEIISPEKNVLEKFVKLKPFVYKLKTGEYPQFNFSDGVQHGFVAQDLIEIFPELVENGVHAGETDSLGNEITASVNYKAVNYVGMIPITAQAVIEVNAKIDKATLSDVSLKMNVVDLPNSLDKVRAMRGVSYDWDYTNHPELALDSSNHVGFIAQEINIIDSRLTFYDANNFMHVAYDKVVPILVESVDELAIENEIQDSIIGELHTDVDSLQTLVTTQQGEIDALKASIARIEACLLANGMQCEINQSQIQQTPQEIQNQMTSKTQVTLSNKNSIVLFQNVPNPYSESTVIEYNIPTSVQKAQIQFFDGLGQLINAVDITERGRGELTVFANDLSTGIYTYTLVADGKQVATKKMMKK